MPKVDVDRVPRRKGSGYPPPFAANCADRIRQRLETQVRLHRVQQPVVHKRKHQVGLGIVVAPGLHQLADHRRTPTDRLEVARAIEAWLVASPAPAVEDLVAATGLSRRQVERRTKALYGVPPKLLSRKYRALRAAVTLAEGAPIGEALARLPTKVAWFLI